MTKVREMKNLQRELLIMLPEDLYGEETIANEAEFLDHMLKDIDTIENTANVVEYLNLNRGKITQKKLRIETALRRPVLDPFQFIIHKN